MQKDTNYCYTNYYYYYKNKQGMNTIALSNNREHLLYAHTVEAQILWFILLE